MSSPGGGEAAQRVGSPDGAPTPDTLLRGRVRLLQPVTGYRVAIDPVLLAAAVPAQAGDTVLDAGAGTGAATFCLAVRVPGCSIVGLELQPELAALAAHAVGLNDAQDRVRIVTGDLFNPAALAEHALGSRGFDLVMSNPPFLDPAHTPPPDLQRAMAHAATVEPGTWVDACLRRLKPRGTLVLIDRPDRLPALIAALVERCGDVTVFPLWPGRAGAAAKRVIVTARKAARGPFRLLPGLDLHGPDGQFTAAARAVLDDAAALDLGTKPRIRRGDASSTSPSCSGASGRRS